MRWSSEGKDRVSHQPNKLLSGEIQKSQWRGLFWFQHGGTALEICGNHRHAVPGCRAPLSCGCSEDRLLIQIIQRVFSATQALSEASLSAAAPNAFPPKLPA